MTLTSFRLSLLACLTLAACSGEPNAIECANGIFCPEGTQCAAVQPVCLTNPCGNGLMEVGEVCDDGNILNGDGCATDCKSREGCGDGVLNSAAGEVCDDSNTNAGDGCAADCRSVEVCGNGIKDLVEACDDGDDVNGNGCDNNCTVTACGNAIIANTELCDDGNTVNGDGCDLNCTPTACGNLIKTGTEGCDDGNTVEGDGCDNNCTPTACGNGRITGVEVCDDGNAINADGCDSNCRPTGCGNGFVTGTEICDDGNMVDGDSCDTNCTPTACGNTIMTGGEVCDDGNTVNGDGCSATCFSDETCGNGIRDLKNGQVGTAEVCDDGNTTSGDNCSADCLSTETCGNGIVDVNEVCDDGDPLGGNCSPDCQTVAGCGDGAPDPGEECDDANGIQTDDCRNDCKRVKCGDGVAATTASASFREQCDGGTTGTATETASCNLDCTTRTCGDRKVNFTAGERCDDGNVINADGCDNNCTVSACGNAIQAGTEQCDDGNTVSNDGCDANCKLPACQNGILNPGEACDDGNATNGDGCDSNCKVTACGNSITTAGEQCDDGNPTNGDGCDTNCKFTACGNGIPTAGEQCDDGNAVSGDGCDTNCKTTACGNGIVTSGEVCDDGNAVNGDGCDNNCKATACGNGVLAGAEQCDDGNVVSNDGCDANCRLPGCQNGIVNPPEACDDGNATNGDGCDANCKATACGNGVTTTGEQCDDGNTTNTDDCTNTCRFPVCGDSAIRTTSPTEQCDDGNAVTETCAYGAASCTVCSSSCQNASGATTSCGDGIRQVANETCDDGNATCGSCSADCQVNTTAKATGSITVIKADDLSDGERFTLNDGIHAAVTFEYNSTGGVSGTNVAISIDQSGGGDSSGTVRTKTKAAINGVIAALEIVATDGSGSTLILTHERFTNVGNVTSTETVSDGGFGVSGMSGGLGGDCATSQSCRSNADCLSGSCSGNVCVSAGVTIAITAGPPNPTNDSTPTVTFTAGGGATSTQCRVDAGAFATCSSPFTTTALTDGNHSITVQATDAAMNTVTDTTGTFTVDTVGPVVTVTPVADPTADNTPDVVFSSPDATSFTCQVDGGAQVACTSPFTPTTLSEGSHTVTVRGTDAATNTGTGADTFTVDTVAPVVTLTVVPPNPTNDNTPSVSFTAPGATTTCQIDAGVFNACTSPFVATTLADGPHTITVRGTDTASNTSTASTTFTVDTAPPTITISTPPPSPTNDNRPDLAFIVVGGPATTACQVDAGAFVNCVSPFTPAALSDGAHTITIRATDLALNTDTDSAMFTVDTTAPVVTLTAVPPDPTNDPTPSVSFTAPGATTTCQIDGGAFNACTSPFTATTLSNGLHTITVKGTDTANNSDNKIATFTVDTVGPVVTITMEPPANTNDNTPSVSFTITGTAITPQCRVDAGALVPCTSPFTSGVLADGAHTISVVGTDDANNTTTDTTASFTVDTIAPTITITSGPDDGHPTGDDTQTFTFTASGATGTTCKVDGGAPAPCTSPFNTAALAPGVHTITITASDAALNTAVDVATNDLDPTVMCLDGTTDHGNATITGLVEGLGTATVEFWFRGISAASSYELVDFDVPSQYPFAAGDSSVNIAYSSTGSIVVTVRKAANPNQTNTTTYSLAPVIGFALTDWHHYAVVFDTAALRLYIDGVAVAGVTVGSAAIGFDDAFAGLGAAIAMHVGVDADTANAGFAEGGFLDLRVSSIARYSATFTPTYPQTTPASSVLLYPLDEGTGVESFDLLNPSQHKVTWTDNGWATCF